MIPDSPQESAGAKRDEVVPADPLRHAVQFALTIYLMPVIAIVCAIGGASLLLDRAIRLGSAKHQNLKPGHLPIPRVLSRSVVSRGRQRTRVGP